LQAKVNVGIQTIVYIFKVFFSIEETFFRMLVFCRKGKQIVTLFALEKTLSVLPSFGSTLYFINNSGRLARGGFVEHVS
jgi:hypothetical protein